jgi:hypothetical protein
MATNQRFAAWVKETKALADQSVALDAADHSLALRTLSKALVWALLTIAIAIHEAAEKKGK